MPGLCTGRADEPDSVTITNGVVQEFDAGVQLGNGPPGIVDDMTIQLQELAGIQLANADDGTERQHRPQQHGRRPAAAESGC